MARRIAALAAVLLSGAGNRVAANSTTGGAAPWGTEATVPGLVCEFAPAAGAAGGAALPAMPPAVEARAVDRVALHVLIGEPPCEGVAPGRFHARWRGRLVLDLRSKLRFAVRGRGHARLMLGDKVVLEGGSEESLALETAEERWPQGENEFTFDYASPADGSGEVRLLWAGRGFDWEPLPPAALRHDPATFLAPLARLQRGRELFLERRCIACHSSGRDADAHLADLGAPELAARAPALTAAGARLQRDWLVAWLLDPRSLRPTARMPKLLAHGAGDAADVRSALDLAAWLLTRGEASAAAGRTTESTATAEQVRIGGQLFAELGCIACHSRPEARGDDSLDRIPLDRIAAKWRLPALAEFLRDPAALDPWIRMPDLGLSAAEAQALAAFLVDRSARQPVVAAPAGGDPVRGEQLYAELGCAQCHEPDRATSRPPDLGTLAAVDWSVRGCAAEPDARAAARTATAVPDFGFSAEERAALRTLAPSGLVALTQRNRADVAARQLRELHCVACHTIGSERDRWQSVVTETADLLQGIARPELDQARPPLTFVGEKLHSDWIERLLSGEVAPRVRPWLHARMPAWKSRAKPLAVGLAARDGFAPSAPAAVAATAEERAAAQRLLFDSVRGFACVSCHDIGAEPARSRFEFGAPNLDRAHERIRPDYFRRWMANPSRVEPSSKMPNYAGDDGKSPFADLFEGDLPRQFEAIRRFLAETARAR